MKAHIRQHWCRKLAWLGNHASGDDSQIGVAACAVVFINTLCSQIHPSHTRCKVLTLHIVDRRSAIPRGHNSLIARESPSKTNMFLWPLSSNTSRYVTSRRPLLWPVHCMHEAGLRIRLRAPTTSRPTTWAIWYRIASPWLGSVYLPLILETVSY